MARGAGDWLKLFGGESPEINFGDAVVLAGIHKRLGELYEAKGDRQRAASVGSQPSYPPARIARI